MHKTANSMSREKIAPWTKWKANRVNKTENTYNELEAAKGLVGLGENNQKLDILVNYIVKVITLQS